MKKLPRFVLSLVVTAAVGYGLAIGVIYFTQDRLMYHPDTRRPDRALAGLEDMAEVTLRTEDGLELLAWYKPPVGNPGVTLVYFHGNAGNIAWAWPKARPLLDAGLGLLLVGYRGYGQNAGTPSEAGFYADGRAALDFLASRQVAEGRVALYGESLGTGVAVQMAVERPVGAVILESPYTSTVDVGAEIYSFLPVRLLARDRFDSVGKIAEIEAPLLVLHGEADSIVPVRLGRALLAAAREPKEGVFIPGAGHGDLWRDGVRQTVLDFLTRHIGS
jgi:fermentation-respiration switch protein FrsA (DUF1100 family)